MDTKTCPGCQGIMSQNCSWCGGTGTVPDIPKPKPKK